MLAFLFCSCFVTKVTAQTIQSSNARAIVGETCHLPIIITVGNSATISVKGNFKLSNSTVFYPEGFSVTTVTDSLLSQSLQRTNDSMYSYNVVLLSKSTDTTHYLHLTGEALAGSDSVCIIQFDSTICNTQAIPKFSGTILSTSIGTPFPYVRFASLEVGYPNPSPKFKTITWAYRTDKESDITFTIFDLLGRRIKEERIIKQTLGVHLYSIIPDLEFPTGVYTIRMTTNSGNALQRFVIFD